MATFETYPDRLKKQAQTLSNVATAIKNQGNDIKSVRNAIHLSDQEQDIIKKRLDSIYDAVIDKSNQTKKMATSLEQIASLYSNTEKQISGSKVSHKKVKDAKDGSANPWYNTSGAVASGSLSGEGTFLGASTAGTISGEVLGWSTKTSVETGVKWKKNEKTGKMEFDSVDLVDAKVSAEGHLLKGSAKGNWGYLSGEGDVTIASVGAGAGVTASLFKDGKLAPELSASAKAEATAAKGSAKASLGTEENNAHVKADGSLATASAEAKAGAGKVTYKNASGKDVSGYGVAASAGAEAYLAKGTVSGGISIFGIDIDVSATGKAGGAGANASAGVSTGGVSAGIGLGVVVGAELGISIDWSNFSLFKKK